MENKDRFFIPKVIKVGYQNRESTYTGKLAYVIYIDQTGKVRKEQSWKNWKDDKIKDNEFENIPTEGFVLNKHVGGYKSDWNFRQSYCRIYDPRGFEFEITIDNLLWILDWEDCMHGKGLTGRFVYGWIGDQLTLIPCCTDDYKASKDISDMMYEMKNISKSDMVPGALYKVKTDGYAYEYNTPSELVFIGNLKVVQKLGKSYKSCLLFYNPNVSNDKKKTYTYTNPNDLIVIDKKNVKGKLCDNAIDEATLNDLLYRWSICAYSYDFWNTNNIIEKFLPFYDKPEKKTGTYWSEMNTNSLISVCNIIDDTHVTLYKEEQYSQKQRYTYGYREYDIDKRKYKFIDLDASMNITKYCDFGDAKYFNYNQQHYYHDFDEHHPNKKKDDQSKAIYGHPTNDLFYLTKDGYISHSLAQLLIGGSLSYIDNTNMSYKYITLPTKYEASSDSNGNK